jgi:predicted metal-dependent phosphoesterase TrpH
MSAHGSRHHAQRRFALNELNFDLHNHSNASDGLFSAAELVTLAHRNGCDALALTDHDTVANISAAKACADEVGLRFISGVEISVSWVAKGDIDSPMTTIHIVGLDIDATNNTLLDGLASVRGGRIIRGKEIAKQLVEAGLPDIFPDAYAFAENKEMLGRTHFARALVARGIVPDVAQAFKRFLTPGNPGYIPYRWATLDDAVAWIKAAGGHAVIAHPARYKLSAQELDTLFAEFKALGGEGAEVVTGSHAPDEYGPAARRCKHFGLYASRGADFHGPDETPVEPGRLPKLSDIDRDLRPVWHLFDA